MSVPDQLLVTREKTKKVPEKNPEKNAVGLLFRLLVPDPYVFATR